MSLNKSVIRLSLLAGSSLAAVLASSPALAANECGDPSANGSTADSFTCAAPPYATGLDYSTTSNGDLTVILQNRFDTGTTATGGIRMFGDAGEDMTLLREDNPLGAGDPRVINTAGRAIDLTTQGDGNVVITLTDGDPASGETTNVNTGNAPIRITGSTDAIRAEATGSGSVGVTFATTTPTGPLAVITSGVGGSGVVARSTSGAINVETRGAAFTVNAAGLTGIDAASTTGAITVNAATVNANGASNTHAIRAAATGNAAVTVSSGSASATGAAGIAGIEASSGGGNVNVTSTLSASGRLHGIWAKTSGAGSVTVTTAGVGSGSGVGVDAVAGTGGLRIVVTGGTVSGLGGAIRGVSAGLADIDVTAGALSGQVDFSGVTAGGVTLDTSGSGAWTASGASVFSALNDTVTLAGTGGNTAVGGSIGFGAGTDTLNLSGRLAATNTTFDFGAGTDAFNASGSLLIQGATTIGNLEALNLSGTIYMGLFDNTQLRTDLVADDILRMTSGTFTGSGSARVVLDVDLTTLEQAGCATLTGGADCLDLRGASTAGVTTLTLMSVDPDAISELGAYNPVGVTLVDVAGAGTSAAGHFVLDPASLGYVSDLGGAISRPGLFVYDLRYDPATQRHILVGLPRSETMEYAMLSGAAHSIWHMTAQTVTDRQTDLRERPEAGPVWVRATGEYTRRNIETPLAVLSGVDTFDNGYKLYAGTVMGGVDLISGGNEAYDYAAGLQIGYVSSSFDMNASETTGRFSGATGGAYASLWSDWFFADGTVNINGLTLDYDSPGLGSKTTTFLNSIGAQGEAGLRTRFLENTFAEPLVNLAWVKTSFEEISLLGGEVEPADAKSLRGALGMRLGSTLPGDSVSATWFVTGRAWYEFEGESGGVVHNPGVDLPFTDEFTGAFGEAELGLNVFNAANTLSGFVTSGVKWKDGYSAIDLSLGARMAW